MEDLIREARELKEKVRDMLLIYQYREKILSGEDRDIPADKLYNALVCLGDFASIVEKKAQSAIPKCSNCKNSNTVSLREGEPDVIECRWCRWAVGRTNQVVLNDGDPSKKMP